jgi:hypothetical protein
MVTVLYIKKDPNIFSYAGLGPMHVAAHLTSLLGTEHLFVCNFFTTLRVGRTFRLAVCVLMTHRSATITILPHSYNRTER